MSSSPRSRSVAWSSPCTRSIPCCAGDVEDVDGGAHRRTSRRDCIHPAGQGAVGCRSVRTKLADRGDVCRHSCERRTATLQVESKEGTMRRAKRWSRHTHWPKEVQRQVHRHRWISRIRTGGNVKKSAKRSTMQAGSSEEHADQVCCMVGSMLIKVGWKKEHDRSAHLAHARRCQVWRRSR